MTQVTKSSITGKQGVNFFQTLFTDNGGHLFYKIDQGDDIGTDAIIDLIYNNKPLFKQIALQIKSGDSFYNFEKKEFKVDIKEKHIDYWKKHNLDFYYLIYIPRLKNGYWFDIKTYLNENNIDNSKQIRIKSNNINILNNESFSTKFIPLVLGGLLNIELKESIILFNSFDEEEYYLGLNTLFFKYGDKKEAWLSILSSFMQSEKINVTIIYYLSFFFSNPDHFWSSKMGLYHASEELIDFMKDQIVDFKEKEVIKILNTINADDEYLWQRGNYSQTVYYFIININNINSILENISLNGKYNDFIRESALIIYLYKNQEKGINFAREHRYDVGYFIDECISYYDENDYLYLFG